METNNTVTAETITNSQIRALSTESGEHGNHEMVLICDVALHGEIVQERVAAICDASDLARVQRMTQAQARTECAKVIAYAADRRANG